MHFYYNNKIISFRQRTSTKRRESKEPNTLFKMEEVELVLKLDSRRKSKEESWKEMSNLGCAGHQDAVIVVLLAIIDASVLANSLYRRKIEYLVVQKALH